MRLKKIQKVIFTLAGLLIIFFLCRNLADNWNKVKEVNIQINNLILVLSIVIYIIALYLRATGWFIILRSFGIDMPYDKSIQIYYLSQLARYIPGGIVHFLGRVYLAKKENVPEKVTVMSIIIEIIFDALGSGIISFLFVFKIFKMNYFYLYILFVIVLFVVMDSRVINFMFKIINKKFKSDIKCVSIKRKDLFVLLLSYTIAWFIFGYSFSLFCNALGFYEQRLVLIGVFPSSWVIGFLSPIPGGLGIREGILQYFLSFIYSFPIPSIISLTSRVWLTVGEIIGSIVLLLPYLNRYKSSLTKTKNIKMIK